MKHTFTLEASRLENVTFSPIRTMIERSNALKEAGQEVVSFVAGEPDFDTPMTIKEATIKALQQNYTHYGSNRGYLPLREAISASFYKESGVTYDAESEILITCGGAEAINHALLATINPGDEVILYSPGFVNYENLVHLCGGTVVDIPLRGENHFQINVAETEAHITPKTKMIIINNPCNPTGAVYTKETLTALALLVHKYNLLILSDEIYSRLTYEVPFYSMASFPKMKEHAIVLSGFSKTYAMTGWRLGYLLAFQELTSILVKIHQYSTTCCPTFLQIGLAQALSLEETQQEVERMLFEFKERRDLIMERIDAIPRLSYVKPEGAFYLFVDVSATNLTGQQFADALLDQYFVGTVPGIGLGKECNNYIRLSYATSKNNIIEGMNRIQKYISSL